MKGVEAPRSGVDQASEDLEDLTMHNPTSCCAAFGAPRTYCDDCDLLVGLAGYRVIGVARGPGGLVVRVESPA